MIATVVRVQRPTSVEPGDVALVCADGTIEGFVGGVCAQHSVRLYSLKAIENGQPALLRILPDGSGDDGEENPDPTEEISNEDGTVTVQNPCLSGGAIEAFLEPVLPAPRVLLAGDSPIVAALERIGQEVGLEMAAGASPNRRATSRSCRGARSRRARRAARRAGSRRAVRRPGRLAQARGSSARTAARRWRRRGSAGHRRDPGRARHRRAHRRRDRGLDPRPDRRGTSPRRARARARGRPPDRPRSTRSAG